MKIGFIIDKKWYNKNYFDLNLIKNQGEFKIISQEQNIYICILKNLRVPGTIKK